MAHAHWRVHETDEESVEIRLLDSNSVADRKIAKERKK